MVEKILNKKHILVVGGNFESLHPIKYHLYHVLFTELDDLPDPKAKREYIGKNKLHEVLIVKEANHLIEVIQAPPENLKNSCKIDLMVIVCNNKITPYDRHTIEEFFSSFSTFYLQLKQKTIACAFERSDGSKGLFEKHGVKTYKVGLNPDERAQFCKEIRMILETNENNDNNERSGTNELK